MVVVVVMVDEEESQGRKGERESGKWSVRGCARWGELDELHTYTQSHQRTDTHTRARRHTCTRTNAHAHTFLQHVEKLVGAYVSCLVDHGFGWKGIQTPLVD